MQQNHSLTPGLAHLGYSEGIYLGQGSEGSVYRYLYSAAEPRGLLTPGDFVAVKITPAHKVRENEALIQSRVDHAGIVKVLDVAKCYSTEGRLFLATAFELADPQPEFAPGTSLASCVSQIVDTNMIQCVFSGCPAWPPAIPVWAVSRPAVIFGNAVGTPLSVQQAEPDLRWIIAQVAVALDFLHQHPLRVCHRDVKLENVLVARFSEHADGVPRPAVKLADFGFCRSLTLPAAGDAPAAATAQARTRLGTACYIAPEISGLPSDDGAGGYCGMKADVWSLGILLYTLASGLRPFLQSAADTRAEVMARAGSARHVRRLAPTLLGLGASTALADLLGRMLCIDPNERCTMAEVLESQWMSGLNGDVRDPRTPPEAPHFLAVWDALRAAQAERRGAVAAAYASHASAHAAAPGAPATSASCVHCGWTLPHLAHADVEQVLQEVRTSAGYG